MTEIGRKITGAQEFCQKCPSLCQGILDYSILGLGNRWTSMKFGAHKTITECPRRAWQEHKNTAAGTAGKCKHNRTGTWMEEKRIHRGLTTNPSHHPRLRGDDPKKWWEHF